MWSFSKIFNSKVFTRGYIALRLDGRLGFPQALGMSLALAMVRSLESWENSPRERGPYFRWVNYSDFQDNTIFCRNEEEFLSFISMLACDLAEVAGLPGGLRPLWQQRSVQRASEANVSWRSSGFPWSWGDPQWLDGLWKIDGWSLGVAPWLWKPPDIKNR